VLRIARTAPDSAAARACLAAYYAELAQRFETGFDPLRGGNALSDAEMTPPAGWLLLAWLGDAALGCGALVRQGPGLGEIKRVFVAPAARGNGVARALLARLETLALAEGLTTLRLDTNKVLVEAQAMYRRAGYAEVGRYNENPYAHCWFEKRLSAG
jgi:GNAT superfamily N-acetyltransferase